MNKIKNLAISVACFAFTAVAFGDTVTIVADPWCPYNCVPGSALPGYGVEIANYAFEKAGHKVVYQNVNWARAVKGTEKGKYTAIISAYKEDAPGFVFPAEEFGVSSQAIFTLKATSFKYTDVNSFSKVKKVGIIKGYAYGDHVSKYQKANPTHFHVSKGNEALSTNIKMLKMGRVKAIIEDPNVFMMTAKKMKSADAVKFAGEVTKGINLYFAFSPALPQSKKYASILSDGIKDLRKSGKLKTILDKYGVKEWK